MAVNYLFRWVLSGSIGFKLEEFKNKFMLGTDIAGYEKINYKGILLQGCRC